MIGWFLWFFTGPYVVLVDGALRSWLPIPLDVGTAVCLVFALFARSSALPGLILCLALGRALFAEGDVALHFLSIGVPIAALLPLRIAFFERSAIVQVPAAAFLAMMVPRVAILFAELSGQAVAPPASGLVAVTVTAVCAPLIAAGLRRVPPLSIFVERHR